MINARIKLDEYSNRVLNIFKAKYDLKDKSEAINKFVKTYSTLELKEKVPQASDNYIKKIIKLEKAYLKQNPKLKSMSKKEFDDLFEV